MADSCKVVFMETKDIVPGKDGYTWTIKWMAFTTETHSNAYFFTSTLIGYNDDEPTASGKIADSVRAKAQAFAKIPVANSDINFATFTKGV